MRITRYSNMNMFSVAFDDGTSILVSYETPVAAYVPGVGMVRTEEFWSVTTSKHIGLWGARDAKRVSQSYLDKLYSERG